jgi:hypothetical protein
LEQVESGTLSLPPGCFANFDLQLIDFLRSLDTKEPEKEYVLLKDVLGRRPTILEFHRSGASLPTVKKGWGSWFQFVDKQGDLDLELTPAQLRFLAGLETTRMSKSFKMILLEAFQELDGWRVPPRLETVVARSWEVMQRRPSLFRDLPESMRTVRGSIPRDWSSYWKQNPVDAWLGRNTSDSDPAFVIHNDRFKPVFTVEPGLIDSFSSLVQEIIDYRLAGYDTRTGVEAVGDRVVSIGSHPSRRDVVALPYFPNLQIACGHFRSGRTDSEEHRYLGSQYGKLDPSRHFIAQAAGTSMDGGKNPIRDGDYLLLEHITPTSAGSLTGSTVVIERDDVSGDTQYLLRSILKSTTGQYILRANNPDRVNYPDIPALVSCPR